MDGNKPTLEIIIESAEFSKDFNYFITVQLDGEGEKVKLKYYNLICIFLIY